MSPVKIVFYSFKINCMDDPNKDFLDTINLDQETKHLMDKYGMDSDTAERVREAMDVDGVSEEEAIDLVQEN